MRIRNALPTVNYALERGGRVILMSHLGRPKGKRDASLSLRKVADRLSELIEKEVAFAPDCIGEDTRKMAENLAPGEIMVLENTRFHAEEKENDPDFARELASLGDFFVNDAFGTAHRAHASNVGVAKYLPSVAGFLIARELQYLSRATSSPESPYVAIMGGAKVSDKIEAMWNLLDKADTLLVGGAMAYTLLKYQGKTVGRSMVEDDKLDLAAQLLDKYGDKIMLPVDHICASDISSDADVEVTDVDIPEGLVGLDIGPRTQKEFADEIAGAKLVTWNGPMGYFEIDAFAGGTEAVAQAVAACGGTTIVGGGETAESIERLGLQDKVTHISTGGGACLDFLAGKELPGIAVLK
jgi:3-phosphoglycerate kinase